MSHLTLILLLSIGPSTELVAQGNGRELAVPRAANRPVIDGNLDEAAWQSAARLADWVQVEPGDNAAPHGPTIALLAFDADALYLGIRALDEPGKIRGRPHERDNVVTQSQDYVSINLDPTNSRRRAFYLAVNPLGVQGDGLTVEGAGWEEWDGVFRSAGRIGDSAYTIESPFRSGRFATPRETFSVGASP